MIWVGRALRLLAVLAILLAPRAFAQPFTQIVSTTFTNVPSTGLDPTSGGLNFTLPAFNTEGGYLTLTSVQLEVNNLVLSTVGNVSITNDSPTGTIIGPASNVAFTSYYTYSDYPVTGTNSPNTVNLNVQTGSQSLTSNVGPGGTYTFTSGFSSTSTNSSITTTNPTQLSDYSTGPATVTINAIAYSGLNANIVTSGGSSDYTVDATTVTSGQIEIIYTYVPEPRQTASWVMGFVVLLLAGRICLRKRCEAGGPEPGALEPNELDQGRPPPGPS